jgi:hypothetical protein
MSEKKAQPADSKPGKQHRRERVAQALRDNLRRRKEATRARPAEGPGEE